MTLTTGKTRSQLEASPGKGFGRRQAVTEVMISGVQGTREGVVDQRSDHLQKKLGSVGDGGPDIASTPEEYPREIHFRLQGRTYRKSPIELSFQGHSPFISKRRKKGVLVGTWLTPSSSPPSLLSVIKVFDTPWLELYRWDGTCLDSLRKPAQESPIPRD